MKSLRIVAFFLGFFPVMVQAQSVVLDQWPTPLQLYPRDQSSQCAVTISGRIPIGSARAVSLVVHRNQTLYQHNRVAVDSLTGRFAFRPIIKAELSEYRFSLFVHPSAGDSVRVAVRDSIVCGDVYLVMGQSNAVGRFDNNAYRSEFCRTFGVNRGDVPYNPADTAWSLSNTTEGNNALWGIELQRLIAQQQGIPTAVINGAAGSTSINSHVIRDATQPTNLNTLYGRLLYRATKAGVAGQVRAMIWRQGEAEAVGDPDTYSRLFPQLYANWKRDYPGLTKVYHGQLNLLTENKIQAGALRDYQRRSKAIFGDNEPIATVGLPGYDGIHYGEAGYRQFGTELYRLVARDLYGATDTSNIASPNVRKVFYSTPEQNEITLEFEPGQVMRWPADTIIVNTINGARYTQSLRNFVYTDYPSGESNVVQSVSEQGNRLVLKLTKSVNAKNLTYLPSSYRDLEVGYYVGPTIRNQRGMRALTFFQVPIAAQLPGAQALQAVPIDTMAIRLAWKSPSAAITQWVLERADTSGRFQLLATLPGSATSYLDLRQTSPLRPMRIGAIYQYRIRAVNQEAESASSPVVTASLQLILSIKQELPVSRTAVDTTFVQTAVLIPNPASDQVRLKLPPDWSGDTVSLLVTNESGRVVLSRSERVPAGASSMPFSVAALPVGPYLITAQYRGGGLRSRLIVVR
ncbi:MULTISPECIES: sialate O-acetylesterase [Spirosoma]|nr:MULTISPECIES: sialate O-acetylesterase [Spirosoma]